MIKFIKEIAIFIWVAFIGLLSFAIMFFAGLWILVSEGIKDFFKKFNDAGSIPINLARWEMTGIKSN